jgi:hypothetical protein
MLPSRIRTGSAPPNSTRFAAQYPACGLPCEPFKSSFAALLETNAIIRFGKYINEFPKWHGGEVLLTFMSGAATRPLRTPSLCDYQRMIAGERADVYGKGNEGIPNARGIATQEEQLAHYHYQTCRAYIYMHSDAAPYSLNFIEAMSIGAPIVAPSAPFWAKNLPPNSWLERYEIEEMLTGGVGLIYSSVAEGREMMSHLDQYDN